MQLIWEVIDKLVSMSEQSQNPLIYCILKVFKEFSDKTFKLGA